MDEGPLDIAAACCFVNKALLLLLLLVGWVLLLLGENWLLLALWRSSLGEEELGSGVMMRTAFMLQAFCQSTRAWCLTPSS
jgi:hypothetical protein